MPRSRRALARLGVAPGHRPLDHDLVALLDRVLEVPLALDVLDGEGGVAADLLGALVRAETRVVVDRVVGEVRRHRLGVAGVQRLVVGPMWSVWDKKRLGSGATRHPRTRRQRPIHI